MYGWILALVLTFGIAGGAYYYFNYTQDTIKEQAELIISQASALKHSTQTIAFLEEERETNLEEIRVLSRRLVISEEYQDELLRILHRHDLTRLVSEKPGLTGKVINEGTKKVFDEFESISAYSND